VIGPDRGRFQAMSVCLVRLWIHITLLAGSSVRIQANIIRSESRFHGQVQLEDNKVDEHDNTGAEVNCLSHVCPAGYTLKPDAEEISGSDHGTCCDPAHPAHHVNCLSHVCPAGYTLKPDAEEISGSDHGTCCDPAHPAHHVNCLSHVCPAGYTLKPDAEEISGSDHGTCCDPAHPAHHEPSTQDSTQRKGTSDPFRCGETGVYRGMATCAMDFATVSCTAFNQPDCRKAGGCPSTHSICVYSGTESSTNPELAKDPEFACCSRGTLPSPSPPDTEPSFLQTSSFSELGGKKCGSQLMSYVGDYSLEECKRKCASEVRQQAPYMCDAIRFRHQFVDEQGVAVGKCRLQYGFNEGTCEEVNNLQTFRKELGES